MKSYFAKLAARATLANLPTSAGSSAAPLFDPFEQTSSSHDMAPASVAAPSGKANHHAESLGPASSRTQPVSRELENSDSIQRALDHSGILSPRPQPQIVPSERQNEVTFGPLAAGLSDKSGLEQQRFEQSAQPAAEPSRGEQTNNKSVDDHDERLAEIEREQAVLLRKSDAFMQSLLGRREAPTKPHDVERDGSEPGLSSRREEPEQQKQSRLQPSPAAPGEPKPDDRPSLVIGSLTVEMVPQAASPVTPERQVVIVHAPRNVGSPVPSSRRFGLGQF